MSPITDVEPLVTFDPEALLALAGPLTPEADVVHAWAFTLDGSPAFVAACRELLSPEERQRADRYVFEKDRVHHTVAHGVLRHLLARYCGVTPYALRFRMTASGKPSLEWPVDSAPAPASRRLHFNLSHSGGRALLGVTDGRELGVDLEHVRSDVQTLEISRHYFFGTERAAIENALSAMRDMTFFRYWVAKEAVLKAQGVGLGFPLDKFCIQFLPDGDRASIETLDPKVLEPDWTVRMLRCEPGWAAAIVARANEWRVKVVTEPRNL